VAVANEIQQVTPELWVWEAYEPVVKCDLSSAALLVKGGSLLIDPIRLTADALEELTDVAPPQLIVLTNANHARAAEWYRQRLGIPIAAHVEAEPELDVQPDQPLDESAVLPGGISIVPLDGAVPGEIALRTPTGIVCVGDALIHLEPLGFSLLPVKYCRDSQQLRNSLRKLLPFACRVLTFAHGSPLVAGAHARLAALLA